MCAAEECVEWRFISRAMRRSFAVCKNEHIMVLYMLNYYVFCRNVPRIYNTLDAARDNDIDVDVQLVVVAVR